MTEQQKKDALKYIEGQLEDGYIDLGLHDQDELEIVKEAINMWKTIEEWNNDMCTSFTIGNIKVVNEDGGVICDTDFTDEQKNLEVWKALGLQEEDFYKEF